MYLESENNSFEVIRCRIFAIGVDESGFVTMYVQQTHLSGKASLTVPIARFAKAFSPSGCDQVSIR
jgi:hypothetical protein